MKRPNEKAAALLVSGVMLAGSLLMTTALASPQGKKNAKKAPPKKTAGKTDKVAVDAGKKIYEANGCAGCHKIAGKGGASGPELTHVAKNPKHTNAWLETSIVNPKADAPYSIMPSYKESIKGKDLKNLVAYLGSLK